MAQPNSSPEIKKAPGSVVSSTSRDASTLGSGRSGGPPKTMKQMGFFEHVEELRARFMRALMVFMAGFVGCYFVSESFLTVLRKPLFDVMPPEQRHLYFTSLFENFMTHLKISGYASLMFLSPYFFWEVWQFIAPGLHEKERRLVVPFVSIATLFFLGGASFAYFVLFPVGFKFFITYGAASDIPLLTIDSYYGTCLKLLLLFGLSFELPVFVVLLGVLGLVDSATLRKQRRVAILIITVVAALFAPPDAVSMLILGGPLILMYEGAIWVVHYIGKKRKTTEGASGNSPSDEGPSHPLQGKSRP